jgi:RNA polymerase sigma-54 factor
MIKSGQYLSQKQTQQQRLSPQQIQYIKLLQLPTIALEQRVKEEMEVNPVLEEANYEADNDFEESHEADLHENPELREEKNRDEEDDLDPVDENEEIDWEEFAQDTEPSSPYTSNYNPQREEWRDLPKPYQESMLETLEQQVGLLDLNDREQLIADQILGSIDEDGYFRRDIEALVDNIAFNHGVLVTEEEVEKVRSKIRELDPPGIASKDLRECLLTQLEIMDEDVPGRDVAIRMLRDEWDSFEKKHFRKLYNKLNVDEEGLKEAYECITTLDPKPGAGGSDTGANAQQYIEPDFEVYYQPLEDEDLEDANEGDFIIKLNGRNVPPLRISPHYKQMWDKMKSSNGKSSKSEKETKSFIKSKIESARWFIDSIRQRQHTLMSVMRTIVALQEDFFKYGEGFKPMILKDVADRVNLDISTISRVVNGKYVQTPFGVYELKYFFSEGLETESGEEVSSREVKNIVQDIVDNEDKSKPLSDQAIADMLKEKGFKVARRTVSKYREQLNIPVARLRKQIV